MIHTVKDLLTHETLRDEEVVSALIPYNFTAPLQARDYFLRLAAFYGDKDAFHTILVTLLNVLSGSPDPDTGLLYFLRYIEQKDDKKEALARLKEDVWVLSLLITIFSYSNFFAEAVVTDEALFASLIHEEIGRLYTKEMLAEALAHAYEERGDVPYRKVVHNFQLLHLLRIFANDILGHTDFVTLAEEISYLAEVITEFFYRRNKEALADVFKEHTPPFIVIAFGKLGGCELNYSSDIDLVFVYDRYEGMERYTLKNAVVKLAQGIIHDLEDTTYGRALYRVDMRLRPEGNRGELVPVAPSFLNYYFSRGRTWEKQALIKARVIAGDRAFGERLFADLAPFIYAKYLSYEEIQDIKTLKRRIEAKVEAEKTTEREVKQGYGGIRDIEFIVQFYQLLYGGQYPALRTQNTLLALTALAEAAFFDEEAYHTLKTGYIYLRELEHRLQFFEQSQTHLLPEDDETLLKIAKRMDIKREMSVDEFVAHYKETREGIREIYDRIFSALFTEDTFDEYRIFSEHEEREDVVRAALEKYRFADPKHAYKTLFTLGQTISGIKRNYFLNALPEILRLIGEEIDPDRTLRGLLGIIDAYGAKGIFFELLSEQKKLTEVLVKIAGGSEYLTNILTKNPSFIDEIFYGMFVDERYDTYKLKSVFGRIFTFHKDLRRSFYTFKRLEELRIGIKEILGLDDIFTTSFELSTCADIIVERAAVDVERTMNPIFPFAVVKAGKLGCRELNFGSDLDLIFVYDKVDDIKESTYYLSFFPEFMNRINRTDLDESIYEVDLRLRPDGKQGLIALPFTAFRAYYENRAHLWEFLVFSKARIFSNNSDFADAITLFMADRFRNIENAALRKEIASMRERVVTEEEKKSGRHLHFKKGRGGIFDIDFVLQYYIITNPDRYYHFIHQKRNAIFEDMASRGFLSVREKNDLYTAYVFFRGIEVALRTCNNFATSAIDPESEESEMVAHRLGYARGAEGKDAFLRDYEKHARNIERIFEGLFH